MNIQNESSAGTAMSCKVGGAANALSLCRDNTKIVVAGRSLLKIFSIDESSSGFSEIKNLNAGRRQGLIMSSSDVAWSPNDENLIATAATNGAVVAWDLTVHSRSKQLVVFSEHQRTVTRVSFHPLESQRLISGSQDGTMKMFDLRKKDCTHTFHSRSDGVRNVQFSPFNIYQFAASFDNGNIQIWDYRRVNSAFLQLIAHKGSVYTLDWHPDAEEKNTLATGGRDNMVKIWDINNNTLKPSNHIPTTSSVASVCWRPNRREQLATAAMMLDFTINVWDLRRRYVPFAYFDAHRDIPTGIKWKHNDPSVLFSCSKDGILYMHTMREAVRPGDKTETRGLAVSSQGHMCLADDFLNFNSPRAQSPSGYNRGLFSGWKSSTGGFQGGDFDDLLKSSTTASGYKMKKFLRAQSTLKMVTRRHIEITPCKDLNDYLEPRDTVLEHLSLARFCYTAKNYKLYCSGTDTFSDICQYNSKVAFKAGMANPARTWLLLSQFYANCVTTCNACINTSNVNAASIPRTFSDLNTERGRRGEGDSKRPSLISKKDETYGSQVIVTSGTESEFHLEDGRNQVEDYLTDIAKGRHSEPGFFISDEDVIPSFGYDGGTSEADFFTDHEWGGGVRVPSEAFLQKEDLDSDSIAKFGHVEAPAVMNQSMSKRTIFTPHGGRWCATDVLSREDTSSSSSPPADTDSHLLTEKDLVVKPSLWPDPLEAFRDELTSQQLKWFAENNDVQTAISIMLTLSSFSIPCHFSIDEALIEQWQLSYLNLLAKHELWVEHEQVVKLSKLPHIRALSTSSTVQMSCKICRRRLPLSNSWSCDRRVDEDHMNKAVSCFLCNLPVTGLYSYCQGCNFGGHSKCVEAWMKGRTLTCRNHNV